MLNVNLQTLKGLKVHVGDYLDTAKQVVTNKFVVVGLGIAGVSVATKFVARKIPTINIVDYLPKVIGEMADFKLAGIPIGQSAMSWLGLAVGGLVVAEIIRLGFAIRETKKDEKGNVLYVLVKEGFSIILLCVGIGLFCKIIGQIWGVVTAF
jgi:heterodisulfide reductase subunit A-like polyferredoxin